MATTKQELIDQVETLRQRCETARDQLWQRYLIGTYDQYVHKLCGDFSGLLSEITAQQGVMAQYPESPMMKADREQYDLHERRLNQLLGRVRDAKIDLPVLAQSR